MYFRRPKDIIQIKTYIKSNWQDYTPNVDTYSKKNYDPLEVVNKKVYKENRYKTKKDK